jgi:NADPH:quinone reductase-like Zn-dependent oxidoreductase
MVYSANGVGYGLVQLLKNTCKAKVTTVARSQAKALESAMRATGIGNDVQRRGRSWLFDVCA